ncbi:hypothetical protein FS749_007824 [Ceratobasidium sp. UAMH 11750]|nr:hypothetical protein FS749_007824 [Ceratobasidium sp. UAMH 11750]
MSPKKAHEVDRLGQLIDQIFSRLQSQSKTRLIVDVGAGQGYLSHKLATTPGTRVLALDGDESQTEGAALRGQGLSHAQRQQVRKGGGIEQDQLQQAVTHRTLFITSDSLSRAVEEWILALDLDPNVVTDVLVTGLHACGSLTPAVLRCFVDLMRGGTGRTWRPSALALVGCCYNLMRDPNDFPLSQTTIKAATTHLPLKLTPNHLQLAAQCPAQWSRSASERERAALARRKIVWRALLARALQTGPGTDTARANRLGRLPDRAYATWEVFVDTACTKLGVSPPGTGEGSGAGAETLAFQLELLHVLRALIGPVVESLIVVDRAVYLAEQVTLGGCSAKVRAVNVFDQLSSGSTRNIALVVEPNVETS